MSEHAMDLTHDVISAFIDNEPFDPQELARALADPGARDLLIDLIALRQVVSADLTEEGRPARTATHAPWRALAAAAAIVLAIGGAYAIGQRRPTVNPAVAVPANAVGPVAASDVAPAPTRVIDLKPGVEWHQTGGGH